MSYNGTVDPKELYSNYDKSKSNKADINKPIKSNLKESEIKITDEEIKYTDEIFDESYEDEYDDEYYVLNKDGYATKEIKSATISIFKNYPVFESEQDAIDNIEPYSKYGIAPEKRYLVPEVPTIKVRYHKELCPDLIEMKKIDDGDFIDLRAAENVNLKSGEYKLISLGISVQLPKGYYAEIVPRSSTYKNFGIVMSNSIGIIDESYCGDNDIWHFPAIAMRDTEIHINDRICQFRIVKIRNIEIEVVNKLNNKDRGGIGSTGKN